MVRDPICGMEVSESQAAASPEYKGQRFYFCALSCYDAFEKDPLQTLKMRLIGKRGSSPGLRGGGPSQGFGEA